jgi:hypothetical protein
MIDAADTGNEYLVTQFLKNRVSPNIKGDFNTTALMRASIHGYDETVRYLLEAGADVHAKDVGGATALHLASRGGHVKVIDMLLKYGASPDANDLEGYTPLKRAILSEDLATVDSLLKNEADVNMLGPTGVSAMDLVDQSSNQKLRELVMKSQKIETLDRLEPIPSDELSVEPISPLESKEADLSREPSRIRDVEVREAIEVPESSDLRSKHIKAVDGSSSDAKSSYEDFDYDEDWDWDLDDYFEDNEANDLLSVDAVKKNVIEIRQLSMEVSGFRNEEEAIKLWYDISNKKVLDGKGVKIVYDNSSQKTEYKLRFDGYYSPKEVFEGCKKLRSLRSDMLCYVIHNIY